MADEDIEAGSGGTAQSHPIKDHLPVLVAPTTEVALNTVKAFLIPVGCWRVDDVRFKFDSSQPGTGIRKEMALLKNLIDQHPGAPLSIFGHADPTGDDSYNKVLSGRRATAIYGMLTRDTAKWERLFSEPFGGDSWGLKSIQQMLKDLGTKLKADGKPGKETTDAIKNFQTSKGLPASGSADKATRAVLFADYMDLLCVDRLKKPWKLQKSDFLAKGADADGKGDFQGCGEFNPFLVFSKAEAAIFASPDGPDPGPQTHRKDRDDENAPNRRVMALLFKPGTVISPAKWPCPTVNQGIGGCKARFWSDGETRRNPQDERRTFDTNKNTYGCRFYHRLFSMSPCGAGDKTLPSVLEIQAAVPGTKGVRDPSKQRRRSILRASSLTDSSLAGNPPVLLVQGCNDVELEASISAPADVTWSVAPVENTNPAPAITPDAASKNLTKATLSSAQGGSFSVTASIGASKVVWNVVFVSVIVHADTSSSTTLDNGYVDGGSDATDTSFKSGEFKAGQFAWAGSVKKIDLVGGGTSKTLGLDRVRLGYLQNGPDDTLTGNYRGGSTLTEQPFPPGPGLPAFPVTDSNGDANNTNPAVDPGLVVKPDQETSPRSWDGGDSPAGGFPRFHNGHILETISGANFFRAAVASFSVEAPDAIVVHAENNWNANYSGAVATTGKIGTYTANGAHTTAGKRFTLIAPATNGTDAGKANFDTFEPRFNNGTRQVPG